MSDAIGTGVMRLVPPAGPGPREDLEARLRALEAAARRVRHGADAEAVHDLRVATRRLAAALALWAPVLETDHARVARRRARRLRRRLRTTRDLEVAHAGVLERLGTVTPETREPLMAFAARLTRRLTREAGSLRAYVTRRRIARTRRAVERALPSGAASASAGATAAMARAHVAERRAIAMAALTQAAAASEPARWHRARLDLKRWRYATECVRAVLGPDAPEAGVLAALRETQEALGRVQDLEVLRDLARRRAGRMAEDGRAGEATTLGGFADALAEEQRVAMERAYRLGTILSTGAAGA